MSTKNKLAIFLITYNRKEKLHKTLEAILAKNSPIKNYDITILDNASTDGSSELIDEYCAKHQNLKHIRHGVNIGGNANICRAFEMGAACGKEYFWVLCDDDKYDFSNWKEVEERISAKDDVICLCDYICDNDIKKKDPAYQIFQLTFVPAGIYKSSMITDDVLINMYDAILTMFQQSVVTIKIINEKGKVYVLSKPIVFNGIHFEDKVDNASLSYVRGSNEKWILERRKNTTWILGYLQVLSLLKGGKNMQQQCLDIAIPYKDIYSNWSNFYYKLGRLLLCNKSYFWELFDNISFKHKIKFLLFTILFLLPIRYRNTPKGIILVLFWKLKIRIWSNAWIKKLKN